MKQAYCRYRGLSLLEVMIVIAIIGILAAIAVPKLAGASAAARENSLKDDLRLLRTQFGVYRSQHRDVSPGYLGGDTAQTPTQEALADQLMKFTDNAGNVSDTSSVTFRNGPYVTAMPVNPVNGKSTWKFLGASEAFTPDDSTGWLYQPSTGIIQANVSGTDSSGKPVIDY